MHRLLPKVISLFLSVSTCLYAASDSAFASRAPRPAVQALDCFQEEALITRALGATGYNFEESRILNALLQRKLKPVFIPGKHDAEFVQIYLEVETASHAELGLDFDDIFMMIHESIMVFNRPVADLLKA